MTLSLSHSQHVQTQKGLATQGRGLDNEDLLCFESGKVTSHSLWKAQPTYAKFLH